MAAIFIVFCVSWDFVKIKKYTACLKLNNYLHQILQMTSSLVLKMCTLHSRIHPDPSYCFLSSRDENLEHVYKYTSSSKTLLQEIVFPATGNAMKMTVRVKLAT